MYVCMYVYIYIYIYTHTYIRRPAVRARARLPRGASLRQRLRGHRGYVLSNRASISSTTVAYSIVQYYSVLLVIVIV